MYVSFVSENYLKRDKSLSFSLQNIERNINILLPNELQYLERAA